jgi:hypothetical protein
MTLRDQLLARRPKPEAVTVDGMTLHVLQMNGADLFKWQGEIAAAAKVAKDAGAEDISLFVPLLLRTLADADGRRLLTDDDAEALKQIDGGTLTRLFKVSMRLNGLDDEGRAAAAGKSPTPVSAGG